MIARLVSGGQSGVDRAALDAALELGVPCGGWCPKGRKAEGGALPARYPLPQTPSGGYSLLAFLLLVGVAWCAGGRCQAQEPKLRATLTKSGRLVVFSPD